jgi:MFS family permease
VPIGLLALVVGWIKLPRVSGHEVPAPYFSAAALITAGIATLTFGIVKLNDWGWNAPAVALSFAAAAAMLALFVAHCLRSDNPFVDPALFRIGDFTRATLTMAPFSTAFGGFLLSLVLWEEGVWHWPAVKIGLAIAPGPFMVPVTSLLLAGRLIARFGATTAVAAGLVVFAAGVIVWAVLAGSHPDLGFAVLCVIPSGIGVGLTLPTLMGVGTSALPASSFATGSGVINMVRQIGFAVGVAIFVAIVGSGPAEAHIAAFRLAWWVMAVTTALGLLPLLLLRRWKHTPSWNPRKFARPSVCAANGGYDFELVTSRLDEGNANLFAFGRPFISTPDLAERLKTGAPQEMFNQATVYGGGAADMRAIPPSQPQVVPPQSRHVGCRSGSVQGPALSKTAENR